MHFSNDLLRTFVAVAESGNFTRAGERVNRTQSAVSMQIKRLETEAGHALFRRGGGAGGVTITERGRELLRYARKLLALHDEAVAAVARPGVEGRVRLGLPEDYSSTMLPDILARFSASNPNTEVDVICANGSQTAALVDAGELDLCIRAGIHQGTSSANFEILRREPLVWIVSRGSLAQERDPVPLAVYHEGCSWRQHAVQALEGAGKNYRIAVTSLSISGIMAAVRAGLAVGAVGASSLTDDLRVLGHTDGFPRLPNSTISLTRRRGHGMEAANSLAEHVREGFLETAH